jgi:hypothetical protein
MRSLILTIACAALLSAGCSGSFEPSDKNGLAGCYQAEFGVLPPADATILHGKQVVVGDAAQAWLKFQATPVLVDSLLAKGFSPVDRETFLDRSDGGNRPAWWNPESSLLTAFYVVSDWRKDYHNSRAYIAHDANKQTVFFCHVAID